MGYDEVYREAAGRVARFFIDNNIGLVYGGANVGLMKILADEMLAENKEVIGVMPTKLIRREVAHNSLTRMIHVESMAERSNSSPVYANTEIMRIRRKLDSRLKNPSMSALNVKSAFKGSAPPAQEA